MRHVILVPAELHEIRNTDLIYKYQRQFHFPKNFKDFQSLAQ